MPGIHTLGTDPHSVRVSFDGYVVAYSGDTEWTDDLLAIARDADLFVCEAYYEATVQKRRVAIYVFDDAEVLDFAGPFEVFSVTGRRSGEDPFDVYLVAEHAGPIRARNGFVVVPPYTFANCPPPDILLVPGGYGTRREMHRREPIEWITQVAKDAELVVSVCSGALLLAKAGMLAGLRATTHHGAAALLQETEPNCIVSMTDRVVDNGRIVLSAGISAGIDMALHMVARLHGEDVARETATYMEYDWAETRVSAR